MAQSRVAGRYAKALLDLAQENNNLDVVYSDMNLLRDTLKNSKELNTVIESPVIPTSKKVDIFKALFQDKMNPISFGFLNLVLQKRREADVEQIADQYVTQYNSIKNITEVVITSAEQLSPEAEEKLIQKLQKDAGLQTIKLFKKIDESIIGGYIVEFNNRILDNSVRTNLNQLKRQLRQ